MGDAKKSYKSTAHKHIIKDEQENLLEHLENYQIYFQHAIEHISTAGEIEQFYDNLRGLIGCLQKLPSKLNFTLKYIIHNICISLMEIIVPCSLQVDGQMLCTTAFCSALLAVSNISETRNLFYTFLLTDDCISLDFDLTAVKRSVKNVEVFRICLCHGILQSRGMSRIFEDQKENGVGNSLCYLIFNIIEEACMKYSRLTSIAFKVLVSWINKMCLELQLNVKSEVLRRIFSVVNSNWESPINGVKDQNTKIFDLCLNVCTATSVNKSKWDKNDKLFQSVTNLLLHVIEEQSWKMKSKYFMLKVLLPRYGVKKALNDFPDLIPGIFSSLSYSHLVSAGSDVYKICLKNISEDDWIAFFMPSLITVLSDKEDISIEKQNIFNYWISSTLKAFPVLMTVILDQLIDILQTSGCENVIFAVISLMKLGRKEGSFLSTWDRESTIGSLTFLNFLNLINSALRHSNEVIRGEAFTLICTSRKTCIVPSVWEFELLQKFLIENVNVDSASLRHTILGSFTLFLIRLHDSSLYELKRKEHKVNSEKHIKVRKSKFSKSEKNKEPESIGLSRNIQFLDWLHSFLLSNLEPGTNYQRKILSLQLYKTVLYYFDEPSQKTEKNVGLQKKGIPQEDSIMMEFALKFEKCNFKSEISQKTLVSCILDSTDDIRETAGLILMEYFSFKELDSNDNKPLIDSALKLCTSPMFYETESGALLMEVIGNWMYKMPSKNSDELMCNIRKKQSRSTKKKFNMNNKVKQNLGMSRSYGSMLTLNKQQKLLDGLYNKHHKTPPEAFAKIDDRLCNTPHKIPQSSDRDEDMEIELKKKIATFEGIVVMDPEELGKIANTILPDETRIFEGLTNVAKDGLVGQHIPSSATNKPHSAVKSSINSEECRQNKPLQKDVSKAPVNLKVHKNNNKTNSCCAFGSIREYIVAEDIGEFYFDSLPEASPSYEKELSEYEFIADFKQDSVNDFHYDWFDFAAESNPFVTETKTDSVNKMHGSHSSGYKSQTSSHSSQYQSFFTDTEFPSENISDWFDSPSSLSGFGSSISSETLNSQSLSLTEDNFPSLRTQSQNRRQHIKKTSKQRNKCSKEDRRQHTRKSSKQRNECSSTRGPGTKCHKKPSSEFVSYVQENKKHSTETSDIEFQEKYSVHKFETDTETRLFRTLRPVEVDDKSYNSSTPLSVFLLSQAELQLSAMKADLFQAASCGSPLHGLLTALVRLITQSDGPEWESMSAEEVNRTVILLEQTVSYLLDVLAAKSTSTPGFAPSFAEMDEAIKSNIQQSLSELVTEDIEEMQLSPAHQLVLNCIWLNLKACCNLASGLACCKNSSVAAVKRCGTLITQVLTRCRHKGAIEAAGVSLSSYVKTITSRNDYHYHGSDKEVQLMLGQLLTDFLDSLLCGSSKASVTRRSAGLSILIHRIVASDMQHGKPFLHMCMSQLLEIAKTPLSSEIASEPRSVLIDLPQAQTLHFLRILVQDSSLRQDMAQYMSTVALICFRSFSSPVWTIRNAALQLSGALIPKLVGQKKVQDEEVTVGTSSSVEEFFSHFPALTDFMLVTLQEAANSHSLDILQEHSGLVPILSLLAKVTIGVEKFICTSLTKKICDYRDCFLLLISSPIYQVRKLAAKAFERFMPLSTTYQMITTILDKLDMHSTNCDETHSTCLGFQENLLNGLLLLLKYLVEKIKHDSENISKLEFQIIEIGRMFKGLLNNVATWDSCTYFNRILLLELAENENVVDFSYTFEGNISTFKKVLEVYDTLKKEIYTNSIKPGLFLWAAKEIEIVIKNCYAQELVRIWFNSYVLCTQYPVIVKSSFTALKWRLECDKTLDDDIKTSLFIALMKISLEVTKDHPCYILFSLLDIMLILLQNMEKNVIFTIEELQKISVWSLSNGRSNYNALALPVVAELVSHYFAVEQCTDLQTPILDFSLKLAQHIKDRSDVIKYEENFRLNTAKALNVLAPLLREFFATALKKFKEPSVRKMLRIILETILDVVLTLLQDEEYEIRKEAAKFVTKYSVQADLPSPVMQNPYCSLKELVEPKFLLNLLPLPYAMEFLWKRLLYTKELKDIKAKNANHNFTSGGVMSPFDHGVNNIYNEETKMVDVFGKGLLDILLLADEGERTELKMLINFNLEMCRNDVARILSQLKKTQIYGIPSSSAGNTAYHIIAKKILYQTKVMAVLQVITNCDMGSVIQDLQQFLCFEIR